MQLLLEHCVPHAPVRELSEVVNDPHMHERGTLQWIDHPQFGRVVLQHSPMRYDGTPLLPLTPSSALGAENRAVYAGWLGLSDRDVDDLTRDGVI